MTGNAIKLTGRTKELGVLSCLLRNNGAFKSAPEFFFSVKVTPQPWNKNSTVVSVSAENVISTGLRD